MINKISVVIPVYQNEGTISATCKAVSDVLDKHSEEINYEFVLVNDGSTDQSWEILQRIKRERTDKVTIINLTRNFGQISALLAGYIYAEGDCIISMSADLQDPAELTWEMFCAWKDGNNLVVANRVKRNDGWLIDKISGFCWTLLRRFAVPNIPKGGFDFFLMDRQLCDYFTRDPEQHIFIQGRLLFYGYKPFIIPYERRKRSEGKSQTSFGRRVKYFIDGFVAYSFLPLRIMSIAGILFFLVSIIGSCMIAWYVLVYGSRVEGWASLIIIILFLNGMQMMFIGMIGEYLWRNIEETRKRPHYIIEKIIKKEMPNGFKS
ncbi:MAG: glycosyltransferase family 2 protein [Elusimicrobiota bacterium]